MMFIQTIKEFRPQNRKSERIVSKNLTKVKFVLYGNYLDLVVLHYEIDCFYGKDVITVLLWHCSSNKVNASVWDVTREGIILQHYIFSLFFHHFSCKIGDVCFCLAAKNNFETLLCFGRSVMAMCWWFIPPSLHPSTWKAFFRSFCSNECRLLRMLLIVFRSLVSDMQINFLFFWFFFSTSVIRGKKEYEEKIK